MDATTANNVLQHLIDLMVPSVGKQVRHSNNEGKSLPSELTKTEKEVLHYALGYTIRKLHRRFKSMKTNKASMLYLDVIAT